MKLNSPQPSSVLITLIAAVFGNVSITFSQDMPGKGLVTQWAKDVSSTHPLPEYPRPGNEPIQVA